MTGIIIGVIVTVFLINKILFKKEQKHQFSLEKILIAFLISMIIILLGAVLSGKMLGVEVQSNIGLLYEEGVRRMPLGVFRIIFFSCFLIIYYFIKKERKIKFSILYAIFLICISAFEFVLNFFINDFKTELLNVINFEQLMCVGIFLFGILVYLSGNKHKSLFKNESNYNRRKPSLDFILGSRKVQDYSYSIKMNNEYSMKINDLTTKEKLTIFINSLKRRFKR